MTYSVGEQSGCPVSNPVCPRDRNQHTRAALACYSDVGVAMMTNDTQTAVIVVAILLALLAVAWLIARERRRKQSVRLQRRFGPEYTRVVSARGDRSKAEAELLAREKRVERFKLRALTAEDAAKFGQAWERLQTRFVDDPKGVVVEADRLVRDLMVTRGYPMADFESRAADISVDHPTVAEAYRSARAIAVRDQRGEANTEELRKAIVHYRTLFDELLEIPQSRRASATNTEAVHS
jgi:hypothetical protein